METKISAEVLNRDLEYERDYFRAMYRTKLSAEKELLELAQALTAERDELRAKVERLEGRQHLLDGFMTAVPETFGEIYKLCPSIERLTEPHEWDNRTSPENATWIVLQLSALTQQRDLLRAALLAVEWGGPTDDTGQILHCPRCYSWKKHGHCHDCVVRRALEATK